MALAQVVQAEAEYAWPPIPPRWFRRSRKPLPSLPEIHTRESPTRTGEMEPRSVSPSLSEAQFDGAKKSRSRRSPESRSTEFASVKREVGSPLPVATQRSPAESTVGPPGAQIPQSRSQGTRYQIREQDPICESPAVAPSNMPW